MKKNLFFIVVFAAFVSTCTISSCKKESVGCESGDTAPTELPAYLQNCGSAYFEIPPTNPTNGKQFNYIKFEKALKDSLPAVGGVQYAVMKNGFTYLTGSSGFAREKGACPVLSLTNCNKMNIASVTKMFTVACALRLLYSQGLDETATLGQFLPPSWNVPATMANLTFIQMFRHRSGLHPFTVNSDFDNTLSYAGLRTLAKNGPATDSIGIQNYRNANAAMMRIIIPQLWKGVAGCPPELLNAGEITDALSQKYYEAAIRQFVLTPVGAEGELDGSDFAEFETLNYSVTGGTGFSAGNWSNKAGGGGWYMTAHDMAKVITGIFDGTIVSNTVATKMVSQNMGFWNYLAVTDGTLAGHGGDIGSGSAEWHSMLVYNTANGIALAVNINTGKLPAGGGLSTVVQNAYNKAWE